MTRTKTNRTTDSCQLAMSLIPRLLRSRHRHYAQRRAKLWIEIYSCRYDWIKTSKAVQLLREELSKSLSPKEYKEWLVTPNFHPFPDQEKWFYHLPGKNNADDSLRYECPPPRKTEFNFKSIAELEFTKVQKDKLRAELNQGSIAIKNTFEPWIDKGGFHPDLILHRATNLMIGIIDGVLHLSYRGAFQGKYWDVAKHLESVVEVRRWRFYINMYLLFVETLVLKFLLTRLLLSCYRVLNNRNFTKEK